VRPPPYAEDLPMI